MRTITLVICLFLASCGSMINGGPKMVPIASDPAGATVLYQGAPVGVTPCTVAMRGMKCSQVELKLPGFHTQLAEVGQTYNGWVFGNCIFGLAGIVGIFIDLAAGNSAHADTTPVFVTLVPDSMPAPGMWKRPKPVVTHDDYDEGF